MLAATAGRIDATGLYTAPSAAVPATVSVTSGGVVARADVSLTVDEGDVHQGQVVYDGIRSLFLWEGKFGTLKIRLSHQFDKVRCGGPNVVQNVKSWTISLEYSISPEHQATVTSIKGAVARKQDDLTDDSRKKIAPITTESGWFIGPGCPEYSGLVPYQSPYRGEYCANDHYFRDVFEGSRNWNLTSGKYYFIFAVSGR